MTQVLGETWPRRPPLAVLSGPHLRRRSRCRAKPTAVTLACADEGLGPAEWSPPWDRPPLRPYLASPTPIGAQVGGAVKKRHRHRLRHRRRTAASATTARARVDDPRPGGDDAPRCRGLGGDRQTFDGPSPGWATSRLTCNGVQSRKHCRWAWRWGKGQKLAELVAARRIDRRGACRVPPPCTRLAERTGVDMPITSAVNGILHRGADITQTITALLERPFKTEG